MEKTIDVVGVGNAIVDVLAHVDDEFLMRVGAVKGAMTLIDAERAIALYQSMGETIACSGGSAANTMVGLASLGGRAAYIGRVRDDLLGESFADDIRKAGVRFETPAASEGPPTARCLILVTPDAQRTMNTYLGASTELGPEQIDPELIGAAKITYLEGYLWDQPPAKQAFLRAAEVCHEAGGKIALTLSDPFCVERHRGSFRKLIEEHVDVLFANSDEIVALYQAEDFEAAANRIDGEVELAALTRGAEGSVVLAGGERYDSPAEPVERVVDTTGAGDLYAAGFLFGLTRGRSPTECARIGGLAAAAVIRQVGARPQEPLAALSGVDGEKDA